MASSNGQYPSSANSRLYEAADLMLEHSGLPQIGTSSSLNGFTMPEQQLQRLPPPPNPPPVMPVDSLSEYRAPFPVSRDQVHGYETSIDGVINSPPHIKQQPTQHALAPISEVAGAQSTGPSTGHRASDRSPKRSALGNHDGGINKSEPGSPVGSRDRTVGGSDAGLARKPRRSVDEGKARTGENEDEKPPPWSELKTKAGKERKRLPLACIACRRKKIRCSGEKPACKHCLRSRIPCVYKITARKAAPRTDYMSMLDKRLKRMEERVIKIIPKEDKDEASSIPRAILKPPGAVQNTKGDNNRKRAAGEAFGQSAEEFPGPKMSTRPLPHLEKNYSRGLDEGLEDLPSKEIQEHLSEVFFESVYGQSYHLLHKPSYMRRLRAGTVPPVLVLAVCAVAARFSTHPQVSSEPAFLRGEEWAAPAREIALKRYDDPTITILTVFLILGLHEFGTCHGGRSWMFGGMALRMAYALQLHRELDHDPLGQKNDKKTELSATDREIRRRTMWACFVMDRFNSSGTERPAFANEETIKIQLPIKEAFFQMEIPGPTESLDGAVPNPVSADTGPTSDPKDNMGVCAYMIRAIALWGQVVKYLNLGGKQKDVHKCWDPDSGYTWLKHKAEEFTATLPAHLQYNKDNLKAHAAEKLANQFIFLHITINHILLFLHRWSIPTAPGGGGIPEDAPQPFVTEAGHIAIEAANQISALLTEATGHHVVAPFTGYCAFMSSAIHVWGIFSKNPSLEASSKANLALNVKYLQKMKQYWGMFHFIAQNLKSIYRRHADASHGSEVKDDAQDSRLFQYGDWFQKYPHGVSQTDYENPAIKVKKEPTELTPLGQRSDLQSVEDFFHQLSPPARIPPQRKAAKKASRNVGQADQPHTLQPLQINPHTGLHQQPQLRQPAPILPLSAHIAPNPMSPSTFPPSQTLYTPSHPKFPPSFDVLPMSPTSNSAGFPHQLDRHLLYGGYDGAGPASAPQLSSLGPNSEDLNTALQDPTAMQPNLWSTASGMDYQQQVIGGAGLYGDLATSAWFMPFNLNRPDTGVESNFGEYVGDGTFDGMEGVRRE
ncbi:MAG: hypothetical protein Q9191_007787 [Dirinaria sp. TL-2023a]